MSKSLKTITVDMDSWDLFQLQNPRKASHIINEFVKNYIKKEENIENIENIEKELNLLKQKETKLVLQKQLIEEKEKSLEKERQEKELDEMNKLATAYKNAGLHRR